MPGIVYIIGCNGPERYVGSTIRTLAERWREHKSKFKRGSGNASCILFEKYGPGSCWIDILEEVADDILLKERERHWLDNTPDTVNKLSPIRSKEETKEIARLREIARYASFTPEQLEHYKAVKKVYRAKLKAHPSV